MPSSKGGGQRILSSSSVAVALGGESSISSSSVCVCVCVSTCWGGVTTLERKACKGLRAAWLKNGEGCPHTPPSVLDGGWKEGSSPSHAALAKAKASFGGVFMKLPCPRGHAAPPGAPSAVACRVLQGGGGPSLRRFVPLPPLSRAWGEVCCWRARVPLGAPRSTGLLGVGVPPVLGVRWLAGRAHNRVCPGVCGSGAQASFGCPQCPLLQQCHTPRCARAHIGHGGFLCRLQT